MLSNSSCLDFPATLDKVFIWFQSALEAEILVSDWSLWPIKKVLLDGSSPNLDCNKLGFYSHLKVRTTLYDMNELLNSFHLSGHT